MSEPTNPIDTLRTLLTEERSEQLDVVLARRLCGVTALLEDVYKAQNMSACIRTLEAFGIQNVHVVEGEEPFVVSRKTTQGCHKWVDIHRHVDAQSAVRALKAQGYRVLATSLNATKTLGEMDFLEPTALCFGNEKDGITDELIGLADDHFRIPMYGFTQSFNLSVAVAICMMQATAMRRQSVGSESDLTPEQAAQLRERWVQLGLKDSERIIEALSAREEQT